MTFSSYDLGGPDPNPMTHPEIDELKRLVGRDMLRFSDPVIINIGAERGTSTLSMLEARPDAYIMSIDVGPSEAELDNVKRAGLDSKRVIRVLERSQVVGELWPFYVDFIWVDGDHSYNGVKGDILTWWSKVKTGGIMAFHDYFEGEPPKHNPSGAGIAIRELMMGNYELISEVERIRAFRK